MYGQIQSTEFWGLKFLKKMKFGIEVESPQVVESVSNIFKL